MKIGIVGTGNIGATLVRQLTALGDDVSVANSRGTETLTGLAEQTGATPVAATDIADGRQVVVIAVPQKAVPDVASAIRDRLPDDVVVVDADNYVPTARDGPIPALDSGMVESRWTETQLRHPVVKAFNTIGAQSLRIGARPAGAARPVRRTGCSVHRRSAPRCCTHRPGRRPARADDRVAQRAQQARSGMTSLVLGMAPSSRGRRPRPWPMIGGVATR
jgi:predicted dinucleotide-binding enzyme